MSLPDAIIPVLTGKAAEEFTQKAEEAASHPRAKLSESEAQRVRNVLAKSRSFVF